MSPNLLIFGASARAAAFSALRAGLTPWCADLFGDRDLRERCQGMRLPGRYPHTILHANQTDVHGPWMYTGALENWPWLLQRMAGQRPLWGNGELAVAKTRFPGFIVESLTAAGLPVPGLRWNARRPPGEGRWLVKPLASAGGTGIRFWEGPDDRAYESPRLYLQEFIEGEPIGAIYLGDGRDAVLLGVSRQLIGAEWLHAAPFHYCGSIGPLQLEPALRRGLEQLGRVLAERCLLQGLFGVDCLVRDGVPWPVEVNPRYTASVEVLEYGQGTPALALHRRVFEPSAPEPSVPPMPFPPSVIGKAILFARADLAFPDDGPWMATLRQPPPPWELPAFADIPPAQVFIKARRPILTFFTRAASEAACLAQLRHRAADLDRWLGKK